MLTLANTDNIAAKQDVGTDINFDLSAMDIDNATGLGSAVTAQGALSTTAAALIATPAAAHSRVISNMKFTNTGIVQRQVTVYKPHLTTTYTAATQWGTVIQLLGGETAEWTSAGWVIYDTNGIPKFSSIIFPKFAKGTVPANPPAGYVAAWADSADGRLRQVDEFGVVGSLVQDGLRDQNLIINGNFDYAQRQAPGTLTTYSNTTGRTFGADRWGVTNENTSVQYKRTDTTGTQETSLLSRMYGTYSKITTTGKIFISQVIESGNCQHLRGRTIRVQVKMKASAAKTMRIYLVQNALAATVDVIAATFISAFGANTVDPTFGTNLAKIAPVIADNATIATSGITCSVTTAWQRFGGTFLLPADFKNLMVVVGTDSQFVAADSFSVSEIGVYDGPEIREWSERMQMQQFTNCQRYYCKSFPPDSAPIQNFTIAAGGHIPGNAGQVGVVAGVHFGIHFPVSMFKAPTVTLFNPAAANAFLRQVITPSDATATSATSVTLDGCSITATGLAAWAKGDAVAIGYTADGEI